MEKILIVDDSVMQAGQLKIQRGPRIIIDCEFSGFSFFTEAYHVWTNSSMEIIFLLMRYFLKEKKLNAFQLDELEVLS